MMYVINNIGGIYFGSGDPPTVGKNCWIFAGLQTGFKTAFSLSLEVETKSSAFTQEREVVVFLAFFFRGRKAILAVHCKNKKLDEDISADVIAMRTPGFSGMLLHQCLQEAAAHMFGVCCSCKLPTAG